MEFKKLIILLSITIVIIMGIMMGVSYAWYSYSHAETRVSGSTTDENPTVIFTKNEYITASSSTPIYDEDRYHYANKNSFAITIGKNLENYEVALEISLVDIKMANELKIANYKYELLENGIIIKQGNFSNIGSNTSLLLSRINKLDITNYPETYNYDFYIWLSEDDTNQNDLMNKSFSAKININSAVKKK